MRAVIQRVSRASINIDDRVLAEIGRGLVVLLAVSRNDTEADINYIADKVVNMRIFERDGKFDLSVLDVGGEVLLVSQFTLYGDVRKGRRPSFTEAATPSPAKPLYEMAFKRFSELIPTKEGEFQAHMTVNIVNEGPVTILIDSEKVF